MKLEYVHDTDSTLYEHANLRKNTTGQPFDLWVDEFGVDRKTTHNNPRFKVKANGIELDIMLNDNGSVEIVNKYKTEIRKFKYAKQAVNYIKKFQKPLEMHWNHEIDTGELAAILRMVYKTDCEILDALSKVAAGDY